MRNLLLLTLVVTILMMSLPIPAARAQEIHLDRTWQDGDWASALVTFKNTGSQTFKTACTIKCIAYDAAGNKLGINDSSFWCHEIGPIAPGFEDTLEISIELHGATMHHIQCSGRCR